jgi:hypothetical protein
MRNNVIGHRRQIGVSVRAVNPLVAFYDIHRRKGELLSFFLYTTHDETIIYNKQRDFASFKDNYVNLIIIISPP